MSYHRSSQLSHAIYNMPIAAIHTIIHVPIISHYFVITVCLLHIPFLREKLKRIVGTCIIVTPMQLSRITGQRPFVLCIHQHVESHLLCTRDGMRSDGVTQVQWKGGRPLHSTSPGMLPVIEFGQSNVQPNSILEGLAASVDEKKNEKYSNVEFEFQSKSPDYGV